MEMLNKPKKDTKKQGKKKAADEVKPESATKDEEEGISKATIDGDKVSISIKKAEEEPSYERK